MKRFKKPKKGIDRDELFKSAEKKIMKKAENMLSEKLKEEAGKISENIYPVILLACRDECNLSREQVQKLDKRVERYLNTIGDGIVGLDFIMESLAKNKR